MHQDRAAPRLMVPKANALQIVFQIDKILGPTGNLCRLLKSGGSHCLRLGVETSPAWLIRRNLQISAQRYESRCRFANPDNFELELVHNSIYNGFSSIDMLVKYMINF